MSGSRNQHQRGPEDHSPGARRLCGIRVEPRRCHAWRIDGRLGEGCPEGGLRRCWATSLTILASRSCPSRPTADFGYQVTEVRTVNSPPSTAERRGCPNLERRAALERGQSGAAPVTAAKPSAIGTGSVTVKRACRVL